jgi:hypothetical protein
MVLIQLALVVCYYAITRWFHSNMWNAMSALLLSVAYIVGGDAAYEYFWCQYYAAYLALDLMIHWRTMPDTLLIVHHLVAAAGYAYYSNQEITRSILFGIFLVEPSTFLLNSRILLRQYIGHSSVAFDLFSTAVYIGSRGLLLPFFFYYSLVQLYHEESLKLFICAAVLMGLIQVINYAWIGKIMYIVLQKSKTKPNPVASQDSAVPQKNEAHHYRLPPYLRSES